MIDTHSHLLPGVDHGCPDLETSLRMARAAAESGTDTVVCTPHLQDLLPGDVERTHEVAGQVRSALSAAGIGLRLLTGFEIDLSVAATSSRQEMQQLAIVGSQGAVVLEMPYRGWPRYLDETLFRLRTWGMTPVLAHPERNDRVQKSPETLDACIKAGAVVQATVASLTGEFGKRPERTFRKLLAAGKVSLLASDAHAYRNDGWTLAPTVERLRAAVGDEAVNLLVEENPRRLLAGEPLLAV